MKHLVHTKSETYCETVHIKIWNTHCETLSTHQNLKHLVKHLVYIKKKRNRTHIKIGNTHYDTLSTHKKTTQGTYKNCKHTAYIKIGNTHYETLGTHFLKMAHIKIANTQHTSKSETHCETLSTHKNLKQRAILTIWNTQDTTKILVTVYTHSTSKSETHDLNISIPRILLKVVYTSSKWNDSVAQTYPVKVWYWYNGHMSDNSTATCTHAWSIMGYCSHLHIRFVCNTVAICTSCPVKLIHCCNKINKLHT